MEAESAKINQMGILACVAYVVGNVIGSGIFITPSEVLQEAGSIGMSLFIWLGAGLISILGGVAYIELGTGIPSDGGDFAYATAVGWNYIAFAFMIVSAMLTYPASTAVQAVTFGEYVVAGILQFLVAEEGTKVFMSYAIGISLLVFCTYLNMFSVSRFGGYFQILVTGAKAIILLVIISIGGIWFLTGEASENLANPMAGSKYKIGSIVMSAYGALWSYAGWDILNYGCPSVKNPRRALPISLVGGLVFVTITYVLTNFAFAAVLGPMGMKNCTDSSQVASEFAKASMGPFAVLIPFAAAVLLLGSLNANIFCSSRILLEASREGHLFKFLGAQHKSSGSPRAALIFQFVLSLVFTFFNVMTLINYVSFIIYAQKCVTIGALFYIRYTKKEVDSGVLRIPLVIAGLFFAFCLILVSIPFYTAPVTSSIGVICVAVSMLGYHFFVRQKIRPPHYVAISGAINTLLLKYLDAEINTVEEPIQVQSKPLPESSELLTKS